MTTTARIVATKAAAAFTGSIAAGAVGNFGATGLTVNESIIFNKLSATLSGAHDGSSGAAVLTDSGEDWGVDQFIGYTLTNTTDGSSTTVTSNTATTITGVLTGGTDDDWDAADAYTLVGFTPVTYIDPNGRDRPATLQIGHSTIELIGPVDFEIEKPVTRNAVAVEEYT